MKGTAFVSTHRLPVAGALRKAFEEKGFTVELVPSPQELEGAEGPSLVILTGEKSPDDGEEWAQAALVKLEIPLFATLPGRDGVARGRELGAHEAFGPEPDPGEVLLVAHRTLELRRLQDVTGIVGRSEGMREALERVVQIAPVESTVLIMGESGTGKELVARGIHALSPRRHRAFLAVNVAALSETLLESELFGHEKGAFTGAIDARKGFFELADRGTLFLDEIGEMPLSTQTKLLRVLEQREFLRVGGEKPIRVDVRIIAATNQELRRLVAVGGFRRDLYYRLNILNIDLPPLRHRREDIPVLVEHFVKEVSRRLDRPFPGISAEAMEILMRHAWPGNVRELRNLVESMVVLNPRREIGPEDIPREVRTASEGPGLPPVPYEPWEAEEQGEPGVAVQRWRDREEEPAGRSLRPELEFVFRTLVDLRVDMDQLRREFEAYREDMETGRLPPGDRGGRVPALFRHEVVEPVGPVDPVRPASDAEDEPGDEPDEPEVDADGRIVFRPGMTMEELEREAIRTVLRETDGNRRKAAESLGIGERTLYRKIKKYDLEG
jgi:DNA-binding NtrC family response regulator